ncbi:MAG: tyrosine-protein phosphatase [Burkholderiales bacterium]|nr:tyrosine-protein phosphatase [Burkholderiales bacterium]
MPSITLPNAPNFRDLGGYTGHEGRTVRHQRLFRSDHLGHLTAHDLSLLATHIGESVRVLDLRGVTERQSAMCAIPGATVHSLPIEPTIVQKLTDLIQAGAKLSSADVVALMQDTYRGFVRGNTPRFAALFGHVLQADEAPIVFHCTAGKDRTGFAAALLLLALGVPRDVVFGDFMLTNARLQGRARSALAMPPEVVSVLYGVQADFLHAALDAVDADFGSVQGYLREGLAVGEVELARLRELYLRD